jgi:hypothetical protein
MYREHFINDHSGEEEEEEEEEDEAKEVSHTTSSPAVSITAPSKEDFQVINIQVISTNINFGIPGKNKMHNTTENHCNTGKIFII